MSEKVNPVNQISRSPIQVVAGVLWRSLPGKPIEILFARRPEGKPYAGYLEFPGGKCEGQESLDSTLTRELNEELGIHVLKQTCWKEVFFEYPHAYVHLHFFWVDAWQGVPEPKEEQGLLWVDLSLPFLPNVLPATQPLESELRSKLITHIQTIEVLGER